MQLNPFLYVTLCACLVSVAHAHHSHANIDRNDVRRLTGVVSEYGWQMPHVFLKVMAPNQGGELVEYSIELLHPPAMVERGWSADSFARRAIALPGRARGIAIRIAITRRFRGPRRQTVRA